MTIICQGISPYMVDLCIIRCCVFYKFNMKIMGINVLCFNVDDSIVFVNMFMIKSSIYYGWTVCWNFCNYVF